MAVNIEKWLPAPPDTFLSCLHGSEREEIDQLDFYYFLSCLHGSERDRVKIE